MVDENASTGTTDPNRVIKDSSTTWDADVEIIPPSSNEATLKQFLNVKFWGLQKELIRLAQDIRGLKQ
jgi:hypothetical protein